MCTGSLDDGYILRDVDFEDIIQGELVSSNGEDVDFADLLAGLLSTDSQDSDRLQFEFTFVSSVVADFAAGDTLLVQGEEGFIGEILEKRQQGNETTLLVARSSPLDVFSEAEFRGPVEVGELVPLIEPESIRTEGEKTIYTFKSEKVANRLSCETSAGARVPVDYSGLFTEITVFRPLVPTTPVVKVGLRRGVIPYLEVELGIYGDVDVSIDLGNLEIELKPNVSTECTIELFTVSSKSFSIYIAKATFNALIETSLLLPATAHAATFIAELPKATFDMAYEAGFRCHTLDGCDLTDEFNNNSSFQPSTITFETSADIETSLEFQPLTIDLGASASVLGFFEISRQSFFDVETFVHTNVSLTTTPGSDDYLVAWKNLSSEAGIRGKLGSFFSTIEDKLDLDLFSNSTIFRFDRDLVQLSSDNFTLDGFNETIQPGIPDYIEVEGNQPVGALGDISNTGRVTLVLENVESGEQRYFPLEDVNTKVTDEGFTHSAFWTAPDTLTRGEWRVFADVGVRVAGETPRYFRTSNRVVSQVPPIVGSVLNSISETPIDWAKLSLYAADADPNANGSEPLDTFQSWGLDGRFTRPLAKVFKGLAQH